MQRWDSFADEVAANRRGVADAAREAAGPWLAGLRAWDLFGTFTYDPEKVARGQHTTAAAVVSSWKAQRDARRFIRDGSVALGRPLPAVMAVEPHKSGSMHMHGLFDVGGLAVGDVQRLWAQWFDRHGYIELERPRSHDDVAAYCGKYLAKEFGELVLSRELLQRNMKLQRGVLRV